MIKTNKIFGKSYLIPESWEDLKVDSIIKLDALTIPESLKEAYKQSSLKEEDRDTLKPFTDDELNNDFPNFYKKVTEILTDIPDYALDLIVADQLFYLYHEYFIKFVMDVFVCYPISFQVEGVRNFSFNNSIYYLPITKKVFDEPIYLYDEKAYPFCEAVDLLSSGMSNIHAVVSILARKANEVYTEQIAIERMDSFKELPANFAWEVFYLLINSVDHIDKSYKHVFGKSSMNHKQQSAYNRSGLRNFGFVSNLYDVSKNGGYGDLEQVKHMKMYEFCSILSYLRCENKMVSYMHE